MTDLFIRTRLGTIMLLAIIMTSSCVNSKKALYFRDQPDSTILSDNAAPELLIRGNDILSILVSSLNQDASMVFNAHNTLNVASTSPSGMVSQSSGYLVSPEGFIDFPMIGSIKVAGLTKDQLREKIARLLTDNKLLLNPVVSIRVLTFKVTVLGEVEHPGVIMVPAEKISLLEALGLAGDLTINARRDNILVIREESGKKITKRLNLNAKDLLTSPYYYLKSNDVVYAEPNKTKVRSSGNTNLWIPVVLSALSFGVILVDHIK